MTAHLMVNSLLTEELSLSEQKAELWKEIPGYEGLYEASTLGRIRSVDGKVTSSARFNHRVWKQRIIKPKVQMRKYGKADERVCLWKNGKERTLLVSRLVAMTWCDGYRDGLTVNHINGNTMDNRCANLEWVTLRENTIHAFETGLNQCRKPVKLKNIKTQETICFLSMSQCSSWLGRNKQYISNRLSKGNIAEAANGDKYEVIKC